MLLAALLTTQRRARAADDEIAPRHAEVTFVAPTDDVQGLEIVLGELLARLEVSVRFMRVPNVDTRQILVEHATDVPAVARAWIDLRDSARVTMFLSGAHQDRLLIRQVPLVNRVDEIARQEIAHIVEATVDALLVGGRIGVVTEEGLGAKALPPSTGRVPQPGPRLDLGVGYEAAGWSLKYGPLHGPAMYLGLMLGSGSLKGGLLLSGQFRLSSTVNSKDSAQPPPELSGTVFARLDQGSVRALAFVAAPVGKRWTFQGGLGGGIDWIRFSPSTSGDSNVRASGDDSVTVPLLRSLLVARYALTRSSEVFFGLGADFDLIDTHFFVQGPTGSSAEYVVFQPWRLRPLALVGIGSDILAR